jgi:predicted ATP-dependent endonuclease of OLD family
MNLKAFRVYMYRCILDSGWIDVSPLTVIVGKNEAGKTTLLRALHKFNPFSPESYSMDSEWPRGHRKKRTDTQVVCAARFELSEEEKAELGRITDQSIAELSDLEITKDYAGRFEVQFPSDLFPDRLHPNNIDQICSSLPSVEEPVADIFRQKTIELAIEARRLAHEGRFSELQQLGSEQIPSLQQVMTPPEEQGIHLEHEQEYITQYQAKLDQVAQTLLVTPSIHNKAHEYVVKAMPTFVYMSDYQAFHGSAQLDQVKQRKDRNQLTGEDKTLLTIMELSGLDLESEVTKGQQPDREQRQYDLDDASATLTNEISDRWKQRRYEVQFRTDGQLFFTFVKDEHDPSLIRLEERSKGFQWFFSFDLMLMYESKGTFKGCVILLDEPGLHLHPDAQRDLLIRLEEYAKENTLIYTTHLPFMIDLRKPERIRVLNEVTGGGVVVSDDLTQSQPECKFVLQAALGMSGSTSYLVAERNLIVEGVDDFWILTELSRLLKRSGEPSLPEDLFITPAGGASEAAYVATFMIGQKLKVGVLLDSDKTGEDARDKLVKKWLTKYQSSPAHVISLGECVGTDGKEFSVEDLFPDGYYLERVNRVYQRQLSASGSQSLEINGDGQLCKRVERAMEKCNIKFNKGSVAKTIRAELAGMNEATDLPEQTRTMAKKLFERILKIFPTEETP